MNVDAAFSINSTKPLNVGYRAATHAERGRVTDQLILNHLPREHTWSAGTVISDYKVVVNCTESKR